MILTREQVEIIKAVLYFDVFKYPLNATELFENSAITISRREFEDELSDLLQKQLIRREGDFVFTTERRPSDIIKRINGNKGARDIMPLAYRYSKKMASFPFVEGVCLSGSISKNYFDEHGDIDYFVITKPNRLWICRTLIILRYKTLPKRLRRYWCANYFIASDNLNIPDMNAFTGTELAFLFPIVNYESYEMLLKQNAWYKLRFPNKPLAKRDGCMDTPSNGLRSLFELILKGPFGNWLDAFLLEFTLKRWRKKYPQMSDSDFELQFRSRKDVCKRHTHGFQNKILLQWQIKTREFEHKYKTSLQTEAQ